MGGPLVHGALSTQLAVLPLAFIASPVLSVFFKMTTLIIVVGLSHGLLLLPVLLSLAGPLQQQQQQLLQQLLQLQHQYQVLEQQAAAAGSNRNDPMLKQRRKAIKKLLQQQQQPTETVADAIKEFLGGLCPPHDKNIFRKFLFKTKGEGDR